MELSEEKTIRTNLTAAEYWEWRTTISDMEVAKQKLDKTELEYKLLQKDAELHAVRLQLFLKTRKDAARNDFKQAFSEYDRLKKALEESLGQSLSGKVIDDITFEVRRLPDGTPNEPEVAKE